MAQYDGVARDYEVRVVPKFRPIAERLAALAKPRSGEHVLELGAGTGGLSRLLVPRMAGGGHLVLLDISTMMLAIAAEVVRKAGNTSATCVVQDLASLPFLDERFDLIVCSLGYLEESQQAVREAFRVLRRGGRLAMAVWGPLTGHDEWPILRAARREGGLKQPFVPSVGIACRRLAQAGFTRLIRTHEWFTVTHDNVEAYVAYREAFPWRTMITRPAAQVRYLTALKREATRHAMRDGSLTFRWSVTFLLTRRD